MIEMPVVPTSSWATMPLEVISSTKYPMNGKHFEGLLAAFDQWLPDGGVQSRRIDRNEARAEDDHDGEMQEAIGRQIGLVVRVEGFEQNARKQRLKLRYQPG